jgi:lipopolysaccharide biosynthesis glycosyltransferase
MTLNDGPIQVVMMARESYAIRLAVAVRSMADNLGDGQSLEIVLLEDGVSDATRERLLASWDLNRTSIKWIDIRTNSTELFPTVAGLEPLYFARLAIGRYVESWKRAILLDADVMVVTDLTRLWQLPLGFHHLLATRDPWITSVSHPDGVRDWSNLGLSADAPYFNAAVMLVDLEKFRRDDIAQRAIEFCKQFGEGIRYGEQDTLNALLSENWGELDPRWQIHPRLLNRPRLAPPYLPMTTLNQLRKDPWIFHFGGRLKPWDYRSASPVDKAFYEVLDRTQWRNWRPGLSLRSVFYRIYDSPLRNWLHPFEVRIRAWWRKRKFK